MILASIIGGTRLSKGSSFGSCLRNLDTFPPSDASFSTIVTSYPAFATSMAADIPVIPPPITRILLLIVSSLDGSGSSILSTFASPIVI